MGMGNRKTRRRGKYGLDIIFCINFFNDKNVIAALHLASEEAGGDRCMVPRCSLLRDDNEKQREW